MNDALIARVRQMIQISGLNQASFAESIATTPDKLSKSLAGQRKFSTTELALIATNAQTTVDWLLTGTHHAAPSIAARNSLDTAPSTSEITEAVERFNVASEQLAMLADQPRIMIPLPEFERTGRYTEEALHLALAAQARLESLGLDFVAARDLSITLERAFSLDIAIVPLPDGLDGCSWQSDETRLIVLAPTTHWARQRFTLAHELGHILAGDAQELIAESVPPHSADLTEKRANSFAATFLMPEARLRASAGEAVSEEVFHRLVNEFRVSPESMAWRLYNLGLLSLSDVNLYRSKTAEMCALSQNRADLVNRERTRANAQRLPSRLVNEHMKLYFEGETSARPLAKLLDISPQEVRELLGTENVGQ